jgi:hypothetical protein
MFSVAAIWSKSLCLDGFLTPVVGTQVSKADGSDRLERLVLSHNDGSQETVEAHALFIYIGAVPRTHWLGDVVARDQHEFILSGLDAIAPKQYPTDGDATRPRGRRQRASHSRVSRPARGGAC